MKLGKVLGLLLLLGLISYFAFQRMRETRWQSPYNTGMRALEDGRFPDAERDLKAAVEAAEPLGDHDHRLAICLSGLATVYGKQTSPDFSPGNGIGLPSVWLCRRVGRKWSDRVDSLS